MDLIYIQKDDVINITYGININVQGIAQEAICGSHKSEE